MEKIVNKDIRWGLVGITINETWINNKASEMFEDHVEYDFCPDNEPPLSVTRFILNKLSDNLEKCINKGEFDKIGDYIYESVYKYAMLYHKDFVCQSSSDMDESSSDDLDESSDEDDPINLP